MRKKIYLSLFSFALMVLIIESGLRVFSPYGFVTPAIRKAQGFPYTSSVFSRHVFGQEARSVKDEEFTYQINSLGYRGKEFEFEKPAGIFRIIVLGGSAVFDLAAQEEEDWPHLAENMLTEEGYDQVEVINAGVPGHASSDAFGRLFSEVHLMNPDVVVLYNAWNDLKDFSTEVPLLRLRKPYTGDPRIEYYNTADRVMCNLSQVYERIRARSIGWRYKVGAEGAGIEKVSVGVLSETAKYQYRLNLELFCDLAKSISSTPVLMTQARLVARDNGPEEMSRIEFQKTSLSHSQLCEGFEWTDRTIRDVAKNKNVQLIDMAKFATGKLEYCYDHVHTTPAGSELLASKLSEVCAKLLEDAD